MAIQITKLQDQKVDALVAYYEKVVYLYVPPPSPRWTLIILLFSFPFPAFRQPYHQQAYPAVKLPAIGIIQRPRH